VPETGSGLVEELRAKLEASLPPAVTDQDSSTREAIRLRRTTPPPPRAPLASGPPAPTCETNPLKSVPPRARQSAQPAPLPPSPGQPVSVMRQPIEDPLDPQSTPTELASDVNMESQESTTVSVRSPSGRDIPQRSHHQPSPTVGDKPDQEVTEPDNRRTKDSLSPARVEKVQLIDTGEPGLAIEDKPPAGGVEGRSLTGQQKPRPEAQRPTATDTISPNPISVTASRESPDPAEVAPTRPEAVDLQRQTGGIQAARVTWPNPAAQQTVEASAISPQDSHPSFIPTGDETPEQLTTPSSTEAPNEPAMLLPETKLSTEAEPVSDTRSANIASIQPDQPIPAERVSNVPASLPRAITEIQQPVAQPGLTAAAIQRQPTNQIQSTIPTLGSALRFDADGRMTAGLAAVTTSSTAPEEDTPPFDLDQISRQVYQILRRRLRLEQERARGHR
jgi:hypothetical protein